MSKIAFIGETMPSIATTVTVPVNIAAKIVDVTSDKVVTEGELYEVIDMVSAVEGGLQVLSLIVDSFEGQAQAELKNMAEAWAAEDAIKGE